MTFGEKLRILRKKRGISQLELAEKLEVSRQTLSKWENDDVLPDLTNAIKIAHFFHVSMDSLVMGDELQGTETVVPQYDLKNMILHWLFNPDNRVYIFLVIYCVVLLLICIRVWNLNEIVLIPVD